MPPFQLEIQRNKKYKINIQNRVLALEKLNKLRLNACAKVKNASTQGHVANVLTAIDDELALRYLPGMIESFKSNLPGGFYGEKQSIEERYHKQAACNKFDELLDKVNFQKLLDNQYYDDLFNRGGNPRIEMTTFLQGRLRLWLFSSIWNIYRTESTPTDYLFIDTC